MRCSITGIAEIERRDNERLDSSDPSEFVWLRADPEIHIDEELLQNVPQQGRELLEGMYEVGERCPYVPHTFHARKKEQW